jgi:hypothetical protein
MSYLTEFPDFDDAKPFGGAANMVGREVEFANGFAFRVVEMAADGHALIEMGGAYGVAFFDLANDEEETFCFPFEGDDEWTDEAIARVRFLECIA